MKARAWMAALTALVIGSAATAHGAVNGYTDEEVVASVAPVALPVDGKWYYTSTNLATEGPDTTGGWMNNPDQDTLWKVTSTDGLTLFLTDSWNTGDRFEVYVDGAKVLTTPAVANYQLPEIEPDVPGGGNPRLFAEQQKVTDSYDAARYSSGSVVVPAGEHTVNVKSIAYPPGLGGAGLALRATAGGPSPVDAATWSRLKARYR